MAKLFSPLLAVALAGMNFCCALATAGSRLSPDTPDTWPILEASNKFGSGQVCPVRDPQTNKIWLLSAHHMIDPDFVFSKQYWNLRVQLDEDTIFDTEIVYIDPVADLAYLKAPDNISLPFFEVAAKPAHIGDRLWFVGYDWENAKRAYHREILQSTMTMWTAGKLVYMPGGQGGSSGSCVLNVDGEVVGVNVSRMDFKYGPTSGQAWMFHAGIAFKGLEAELGRREEEHRHKEVESRSIIGVLRSWFSPE